MRRQAKASRRQASIAITVAMIGLAAGAVENTQWPPRDDVVVRMRELQGVISSADAGVAEREAARAELSKLLKSPNATGRTPDEKSRPAPRAAIEPIGSLVRPMPNPKAVAPDVATMEVTVPSKMPTIAPATGRPVIPSTGAAVDPRSGHLLHETPFGYVDPRTGQFTPK